jgi:hypothetical protein
MALCWPKDFRSFARFAALRYSVCPIPAQKHARMTERTFPNRFGGQHRARREEGLVVTPDAPHPSKVFGLRDLELMTETSVTKERMALIDLTLATVTDDRP